MKYLLFAAGLMLAPVVTACAQQSAPKASSTPGHSAVANSSLSPVYTDGKCRFRLRIVPGEGYSNRTYMFFANNAGNPNGWGFSFDCQAGTPQDDIDVLLDAKRVNGQWIWIDGGAPFTPDQKFHVYKFEGTNWKGIATTYNDITGDEAARGRNLSFCLFEKDGPQVLCGGPIAIRNLNNPPSASTLPKIMAVLKTIEFVTPPTQSRVNNAPTTLALGPVRADGSCRFRLNEAASQKYSDGAYWFPTAPSDPSTDKSHPPGRWYIGMACRAGLSPSDIQRVLNIKQVDGQWIDTYSGRSFADEDAEFHALAGNGWTGQAAVFDRDRQSELHYCLVQSGGPQVLCGSTVLGTVGDAATFVDRQTKTLSLLKSVVFVDAPASEPEPPSTMDQR